MESNKTSFFDKSVNDKNMASSSQKWEPKYFNQRQNLSEILSKIGVLENGNPCRTYHFTSATNKGGTSTILINLVRLMADIYFNKKVLVIDGNLEQPTLHTAFGLPMTPGLCEALHEEKKFSDVIHQLKGTPIFIMTCGQFNEHRFGFDPEFISTFIKKAQNEFQFIFFDSPPVLTSPLARLWATVADASFLIIQARNTRWEVAKKTQLLLEDQGAHVKGVILNMIRHTIPANLYHRI